MSEVRPTYDDEIDLFELLMTLWEGKWTIIGIIVFSVLAVFGYRMVGPQPNFKAVTEVKPITSADAEIYQQLNALGFFEVTPDTLLNLYIEQLEERTLFGKAIHQHQLLDVEKFEDEQDYNEEVIALASSIELLPPINVDGAQKGDVRRFWTIGIEYNNDDKWKQVLSSVDSLANKSVQTLLQQRFQTSISVATQERNFELEDIATAIANATRDFEKEMEEFALKQRFELEDVQIQIDNALTDYERNTSDRLAFLREQALIARKLGVAKNTIEAQMFGSQNGVVANVTSDTPFYLRGYEAIEKEIELIETRKDTRAFIEGLVELEQKKRSLEQDKTLERAQKNKAYLDSLIELQKKQREIEQNKTLERADELFNATPIMSSKGFTAASLKVDATDFKPQTKLSLILALAMVLGGMVGAMYVLILNALRKRKEQIGSAIL